MSAVPRIGIVSNFDLDRQLYFCRPAYVRAVEASGGLPLLLPYLASAGHVLDLLTLVDGVLLSGGGDLDPALYGGPTCPALHSVSPHRDAFERTLARAALDHDLPLLGICRGVQTLNVATSGSLYPDLPSCLPSAINHWDPAHLDRPVHAVAIAPESRLARIFGTTCLEVNSWHHQAIKRLGRGFHASAHAPDGVIEAIESPHYRFALGVQWHPEHLYGSDPASRRLFAEFVQACRRSHPR